MLENIPGQQELQLSQRTFRVIFFKSFKHACSINYSFYLLGFRFTNFESNLQNGAQL